jgi:hypothetical protein
MAIIALVSGKGSPGVTVTGLACTLSWRSRVILAECDPSGGSILAGYLGGTLGGPRGINELAVSELRDGNLERAFWSQLIDLDAPNRARLVLPGVIDPAQAGSVIPLWQRFTDFFRGLEHGEPRYDVIVDCGRLAVIGPPWPLLRAADVVLVVSGARLSDLSSAQATLRTIERDFAANRVAADSLRLLLVGDGHGRNEVAKELGVPVIAQLPHDPRTATVLSHGGTVRAKWPLMRAAGALEGPIRALLDQRRASLGWPVRAKGVAGAV